MLRCCAPPANLTENELQREEKKHGKIEALPLELRGVRYDARLFQPITIGSVQCQNRIVMAPLTRLRNDRQGCPTAMSATYYNQRRSAGLIISEATGVAEGTAGYEGAPGIWSEKQIEAWKQVTSAVFPSKISCQLWHTGRINHPRICGGPPPSCSATVRPDVRTTLLDEHRNPIRVECPLSREITLEEIGELIDQYGTATKNAFRAGFHMVEFHAAHGYLPHQFYCADSNTRTDRYGGSLENRCRFILECLDACIAASNKDVVGIRLSPLDDWQGCNNGPIDEAEANALHLIREIGLRGIAYLSLSEGFGGPFSKWRPEFRKQIRKIFKGVIIVNGDYDNDKVEAVLNLGVADAVAFGRRFIANPDLVKRLEIGADLNSPAPNGLGIYGGGETGLVDYPFLD